MIQIGASAAAIDSPIEHLVACHRRIEQRLDTLVNAAAHLGNNRASALDAIRKSLQFLSTSGALHTEDEEMSLFPRLRPKLSASEIAFIDSLQSQHDEAESVLSELNQILLEPDSLLTRYRQCAERLRSLYRDHIRAEEETLVALTARLLSESDTSEIAREMRARRFTPAGDPARSGRQE